MVLENCLVKPIKNNKVSQSEKKKKKSVFNYSVYCERNKPEQFYFVRHGAGSCTVANHSSTCLPHRLVCVTRSVRIFREITAFCKCCRYHRVLNVDAVTVDVSQLAVSVFKQGQTGPVKASVGWKRCYCWLLTCFQLDLAGSASEAEGAADQLDRF